MADDAQELVRVLIANRGEIARRLIKHFHSMGVETVVAFAELENELEYLDDADYAVYLNGRTVEETYLDARRVLSAAMDAGCEAIHPGYCFLAERAEFYEMAAAANIAVIGTDPRLLVSIVDRSWLRGVARTLGLPLIPGSDPIPDDDDGIAAGAQLGVPLFVKAVAGGALERVETLEALPEAVARVRAEAQRATGDRTVYLERVVEGFRHCAVPVVADRHGCCVHLGVCDGSLQMNYRAWVEEAGESLLDDEVREKVCAASVRLAQAVNWVGVGSARWAVTPDGGWYLLGFSARLTTGYSLVEKVHGIDLLQAQYAALVNDRLGWEQSDADTPTHGIQLRIFHVDPADLSRPDGVLESLTLPDSDDVLCEVGAEVGQICTRDHDPLLVKLTVTAPTRQAAVVKARAALEELRVEGVVTNLEMLRAITGSEDFWNHSYDVRTLPAFAHAQNN